MISSSQIQAAVKTRYLQANFGAYGDGIHHDDTAFIRASHFFNDSVNYAAGDTGELIIEYYKNSSLNQAKYLVGVQINHGDSVYLDGEKFKNESILKLGISLIHLKSHVNGLVIRSDHNGMQAKIVYSDSLYYGAFCPPHYTYLLWKLNCSSAYPCIAVYTGSDTTSSPTWGCKVDSCNAGALSCDCDPNTPGFQYTDLDTVGTPFVNGSNNIVQIPANLADSANTTAMTKCTIGNFFTSQGARNIHLQDIEVDGNNIHHRIGGTWGDKGIQCEHTAINLAADTTTSSKRITLQHVYCHHMGFDGIMVNNADTIRIMHSAFEYNGRQGLSWVGGDSLYVDSCRFNFTGRAVNLINGLPFGSSPGAGVDIEPQKDAVNHLMHCRNGYFLNCEFITPSGPCLVSDSDPDSAKNVYFRSCTFHKTDGYGLLCRGRKFTFDSCHIYCPVVHANIGNVAEDATKFIHCDFEDKAYNGVHWFPGFELVHMAGYKKTLFKDCTFTVTDSLRAIFWLNRDNVFAKADWSIIDSCRMIYNNAGIIPFAANSYLSNVLFRNKNSVQNIFNECCSFKGFVTQRIELEGSSIACEPGELVFEGKINHLILGADTFHIGKTVFGTDGYALYQAQAKVLSSCDTNMLINIGNHSRFDIGKNASLYGGHFLLNGGLVLEDSSYLNLANGSFIGTSSANSLLYVSATCNSNNQTTAPYWLTNSCFNYNITPYNTSWGGNQVASPLCVQGGNSYFAANGSAICSPLYTKISTAGAFEVMYNLIPNGSGTDINYFPNDPNYLVSLDGINVTANPVISVAEGNHILVITDSNSNCGSLAYITLGNAAPPCCEPAVGNAANLLLCRNSNSSTIVTQYGSTISNKTILVDSLFTIDQSIAFNGCVFLMECNAKISLNNSQTLTLTACTLTAACSEMWDGIYADDPTSQITIENNSVLQDMENGVNVSNNAKINSTGSTYQDNYFSIQIRNNTLANTCVIISNIFKKESGLLFPHNTDYKPETGIFIADCNNISIGDISQPNSGNTFVDMWNGIYIWSGKGVSYPNASIQLCYSSFNAISGDAGTWDNYTFSTPKGWAVYAHNANPMTNLIVKVKGDNASSTVNFLRCDKGVVLRNTNGEVLNVKMKDTKLGVGLTECQGRSYKINNNEMLNTRNGIVKYGDESSGGFYACNNTMSLYNHYIPNLITSSPPVGIISTYSGTTNIGTSYIQNNTINIPTQTKAVGISMSGGSADFITGNTIHFGTTDGEPELTIPGLLGIYSNKCEAPSIIGNVVDNTSGVNFVPGNNAGIYVNANNNSRLQCNSINYTRWGMFGVGTNGSTSDYTLTASNAMRCSSADFMFWALGSEGTFGQVGRVISTTPPNAYDANNSFLGNPILGKVNRVSTCMGAIAQEQIVTTAGKLNPSESLTSPSGGPCFVPVYNPSQPFTETHNCSSIALALGSNSANIDYNRAMLVAENNIVYEDFEEGARRADEEMVYAWLDAYGSIRASNPILDSFYLNRYSQIVGTIKQLDLQIAMLSDSTLMADSTAWLSKLQIAIQNNNSLGIGQVFEANAKWINNLYLQAIAGGIDSIETEMASEIETLANTCPYLGGNAVFRARAFMGMIKPGTHYDDLVICNGQGVYKNGISKLQQQLLNIANFHNNPLLEEEGLLVYPNPASSDVYIDYDFAKNESARLVFYDLLGNAVKVVELNSNLGNSTIDISNFSNGLYVYQFRSNLGKNYFGKLIVN